MSYFLAPSPTTFPIAMQRLDYYWEDAIWSVELCILLLITIGQYRGVHLHSVKMRDSLDWIIVNKDMEDFT